MYKDIDIILATKHQKDVAIRQPFKLAFGADIFIPEDYDTDQFGTFSGEIERQWTPYETVIIKAKHAMDHYGYDYAIANEGSFGPHPAMFFIPSDIELMSFIDKKNNIVVVESEVTTNTNYSHIDITTMTECQSYLEKIKFGSHGLIIRSLADNSVIAKGITLREELDSIIQTALVRHGSIRLETDMRAMMNPTRMQVIHRLAVKMVRRLQQQCPLCHSPGFGKVVVAGNLPCEDCGTQTQLHQSKILQCVKCPYQQSLPRDDGLQAAEAKYCTYCNP